VQSGGIVRPHLSAFGKRIEDKIRKPSNKTMLELNIETNNINTKIDLLYQKYF
jgi:hypothetical protein